MLVKRPILLIKQNIIANCLYYTTPPAAPERWSSCTARWAMQCRGWACQSWSCVCCGSWGRVERPLHCTRDWHTWDWQPPARPSLTTIRLSHKLILVNWMILIVARFLYSNVFVYYFLFVIFLLLIVRYFSIISCLVFLYHWYHAPTVEVSMGTAVQRLEQRVEELSQEGRALQLQARRALRDNNKWGRNSIVWSSKGLMQQQVREE